MLPRLPVRTLKQRGGFPVTYHDVFDRIINQGPPCLHRQVSKYAAGCGNMAIFNISNRSATFLNCGQEIKHM